MSLKNDKFPSSAFFEAMNTAITSNDGDRKQAMDMGKGVYAFTIKNAAGETESWHIDLKKEGKVGKGVGEKPDVTLSLAESDFENLVTGKGNAQRLFMSGKLKIKGNVMKATKLEPILKMAQTKAKL